MSRKDAQFRYIGSSAVLLGNGRPVEPGEFVTLTDDELRDNINETLIHDELLIGVNDEGTHQTGLAKSRVTRRINKVEDQQSGEETPTAEEG